MVQVGSRWPCSAVTAMIPCFLFISVLGLKRRRKEGWPSPLFVKWGCRVCENFLYFSEPKKVTACNFFDQAELSYLLFWPQMLVGSLLLGSFCSENTNTQRSPSWLLFVSLLPSCLIYSTLRWEYQLFKRRKEYKAEVILSISHLVPLCFSLFTSSESTGYCYSWKGKDSLIRNTINFLFAQ